MFSWARHSLRQLPWLQNVKPTHGLQPPTPDEPKTCSAALQKSYCAQPHKHQTLHIRQPLCSGFVSTTISWTLLHQQSNQIMLLLQSHCTVREWGLSQMTTIVDVTELILPVCNNASGLEQVQSSCQNVGTSTWAEETLALNRNF